MFPMSAWPRSRRKTAARAKSISSKTETLHTTHSQVFATVAKEAKEAGLKVEITYTENQRGKKIESLKKIEAPERDPGAEG